MAHKMIPYPCEYRVTASVRRARRAGNVFVIILCILIALLLGAGVFFAMSDDWRAIKQLGEAADRMYAPASGVQPTEQPHESMSEAIPENPEKAAQQPTEAPVEQPTPEPTAELMIPQETPVPTTEAPIIGSPRVTPAPSPDPLYTERMALPFAEESLGSLPDIIDACMPGVVGILNYQRTRYSRELQAVSSGSGFILTADGYIVTNEHVIEDASRITVILQDDREIEAKLIGSDVMSDVAVLKIDAEGLMPLPIGDSDTIRVGEYVLAIGDPLGTEELHGSVTLGIISATARQINIDGFENEMLQTDAAINPGNSGGPLINMKGEVIGVTNAKYFSAGTDEYGNNLQTEGIGFAIPVKNVMRIVDSLIREGTLPRPGIGIKIGTRSAEYAAIEGKPEGVYVDSVTEGGPADLAGIRTDDVILALDGIQMTQDELITVIRAKGIGEQITFTVLRDGQTLDIVVTVGDLNKMH